MLRMQLPETALFQPILSKGPSQSEESCSRAALDANVCSLHPTSHIPRSLRDISANPLGLAVHVRSVAPVRGDKDRPGGVMLKQGRHVVDSFISILNAWGALAVFPRV